MISKQTKYKWTEQILRFTLDSISFVQKIYQSANHCLLMSNRFQHLPTKHRSSEFT